MRVFPLFFLVSFSNCLVRRNLRKKPHFDDRRELTSSQPKRWYKVDDIFGTSASQLFGTSVAYANDGNTFVASSNKINDPIRVFDLKFENNVYTWVQRGNTMTIDGTETEVDICEDGNTVVIGSHTYGSGRGKAQIRQYNEDTNTWDIQDTFTGGESKENFGYDVRISRNCEIVAVLSHRYSDHKGKISTYRVNAGKWNKFGTIEGTGTKNSAMKIALSYNGNICAFAETHDDDKGHDRGKVVVYKYTTSWTAMGKSLYSDGATNRFGDSVSLSDDGLVLAVGQKHYDVGKFNNNPDTNHGAVFIYQFKEDWSLEKRITGECPHDHFGSNVALSGDGETLAVYASLWQYNCAQDPDDNYGRSYIYRKEKNDWILDAEPINGEQVHSGSNGEHTAFDLSHKGDFLAIGGRSFDYDGLNDVGYVRTFSRQSLPTNNWLVVDFELGKSTSERVGSSVALANDGNTYIVSGANRNGAVKVFDLVYEGNDYDWKQRGNTFSIDGTETVVDICEDGSIAVIGTPYMSGKNDGKIEILRYEEESDAWVSEASFTGGSNDELGWKVKISDDCQVVAALSHRYNEYGGYVKTFSSSSGSWKESGRINAPGQRNGPASIALSSDGNILAFGLTHNDDKHSDSGKVIVYKFVTSWSQMGKVLYSDELIDQSNNFGRSVSLSQDGNVLAIGQQNYDKGTKFNGSADSNFGAVFIFHFTEDWILEKKLTGECFHDNYGYQVSLSSLGDTLAVTAPGFDKSNCVHSPNEDYGRIYIYKKYGNDWNLFGNPIDGEQKSQGWAGEKGTVALSADGTILAFGQRTYDYNGVSDVGQVKIFSRFPLISPTISPTASPTTINPWLIKFTGSQKSNVTDYMRISYDISKDKTADQVVVTILDKNCFSPLENNVYFVDKAVLEQSNSDTDRLAVDLEVDPTLLNNENSTFEFCIQSGLAMPDNQALVITMEEVAFTLKANREAGFFLLESPTEKKENRNSTEETFYAVDSCVCFTNSTCIDNPVLTQEEHFNICIISPQGMFVDKFIDLTISQDDLKWKAISKFEHSEFTTSTSGPIGVITTKMIAMFYMTSPLKDVTIFGKVGLKFSSRLLAKRTRAEDLENENEDGGNFIVKAHLQPLQQKDSKQLDNEQFETNAVSESDPDNKQALYIIVGGGLFAFVIFSMTIANYMKK